MTPASLSFLLSSKDLSNQTKQVLRYLEPIVFARLIIYSCFRKTKKLQKTSDFRFERFLAMLL